MSWWKRVKCGSCGGSVDKKAPRGSPLEVFQAFGAGAMKCSDCGQSFCIACYSVFFMKQPIEVNAPDLPAGLQDAQGAKCLAMTAMLSSGQAPCPSCKAESVCWRREKNG